MVQIANRENNNPNAMFCPDCNADSINWCKNPLHGKFSVGEVWDYALQAGILHGHELEELDPYK